MKKKVNIPKPSCASCDRARDEKICFTDTGTGTKGCPTLTATDVLADANKEYEKPDTGTFRACPAEHLSS